MLCSNCGKSYENSDRYCAQCGTGKFCTFLDPLCVIFFIYLFLNSVHHDRFKLTHLLFIFLVLGLRVREETSAGQSNAPELAIKKPVKSFEEYKTEKGAQWKSRVSKSSSTVKKRRMMLLSISLLWNIMISSKS